MNKKRGTHYWVIFLFLGIGLFVTNCSLSEEENISDPITGVWKLKWQKSAGEDSWLIIPGYETESVPIADFKPNGEYRWITMKDGDTVGIGSSYYQICDEKNIVERYYNDSFSVYRDNLPNDIDPDSIDWVWWDSVYVFQFDSTLFSPESVCECEQSSHIRYSYDNNNNLILHNSCNKNEEQNHFKFYLMESY